MLPEQRVRAMKPLATESRQQAHAFGWENCAEQRWGEFHARCVTYIADALQTGLPSDLRARMEERVFVESLEVTERFIRIVDVKSGGRVVTVIELLSPSNKWSGRGREEYLSKQHDALAAKIVL